MNTDELEAMADEWLKKLKLNRHRQLELLTELLADFARQERLACARWLVYIGGCADEAVIEIMSGDLSAADSDPEVDAEIIRLTQSQQGE